MRTNLTRLSFLFAATILVTGCREKIDPVGPDTPGQKKDFSFTVDAVDGVRLLDKVVTAPSITFSLKSKDEAANYIMSYSINDGAINTIDAIWDGSVWNINTELAKAAVGYGKYTVRGSIYPEDKREAAQEFEQDVWMKYELSDVSAPSFVLPKRTEKFNESPVLYEGETGSLVIAYQPAGSVIKSVSVSMADEGIITIDDKKASCADGRYLIPFTVAKTGSVSMTVTAENGPDAYEWKDAVKCDKDESGNKYMMGLSADRCTAWELGLDVKVTMTGGESSETWNVTFSIDNATVTTKTGVKLSDGPTFTLPTSTLQEGEHKLTVAAILSSTQGTALEFTKEEEVNFYHSKPSLQLNNNYMKREVATETWVGGEYTVTLSGVVAEYVPDFSLVSKGDFGELVPQIGGSGSSQSGRWTLRPSKYGYSPLSLKVGGHQNSLDFPVKRITKVPVDFGVTYNYVYSISVSNDQLTHINTTSSTNVSFQVGGKADFAAQCDYLYALEGISPSDTARNAEATRFDWPDSRNFSLTLNAGETKNLINLSDKYEEFSNLTYTSEIWDPIKPNQKKKVNYPYFFAVTGLNVSVKVPYTVQDSDCISLYSTTSWDYLNVSF